MKKFSLILLYIVFPSGCVPENEAERAGEMELDCAVGKDNYFKPEGKLAFSYIYSGTNTMENGVSEYLYDKQYRLAKMLSETHLINQIFHKINTYTYNELDCLVWEKKYDLVDDQCSFNLAYKKVFDSQNRPIELHVHRADGSQDVVYRNTYNDAGKLVERDVRGEREVYTYLENGRIASMRQYSAGDIAIGHLYRYDEKNRLVAKEYFVSRRDTIPEEGEGNIEEFDYDDQDRLVEKRVYAPTWGFELQARVVFEYY